MKRMLEEFNLALFLGCCVISIGIIVASIISHDDSPIIVNGEFSADLFGSFSHGFLPSTMQNDTIYQHEFLTPSMVAQLLAISTDEVFALIEGDELRGSYTIVQGQPIFCRDEIFEWLRNRITQE